jgi:hypothetical protein
MPDHVTLAIDRGVTSTKALLVAPDGAIAAPGSAPAGAVLPGGRLDRAVTREILRNLHDHRWPAT